MRPAAQMSDIGSMSLLFIVSPESNPILNLEIITQSFGYCLKYQPETPLSAESFSSRTDNGQGLIFRVITKTLCYNLFFTYSNLLF